MGNWKEFEIKDFAGMVTNRATPQKNQAQLLRNLDIHEKPGTLTLRPGYEEKYAHPSDATLLNSGFISFDHFYDKSADTEGQEITTLIQQAAVSALVAGVTETLEILAFWIRPYWNETEWVDAWHWLNEIVITKVTTASDSTYKNMLIVDGNQENDYFVGWTIWNMTQDVFAQVIINVEVGGENRINTTLFEEKFAIGDTVVLFKNFIEPNFMAEMKNSVASEIVYHEILNDMRIGFGGKENRVGLSIGYRKKWFRAAEADFASVHSDITTEAMQAFSAIDAVIITEHTAVNGTYGIELSESIAGTTLPAGTYYFKLTGILDDNSEILLAEEAIATLTDLDIDVQATMKLGTHNKRLTDLKVYYSTDGTTYHLFSNAAISDYTEWQQGYVITEAGLFQQEGLLAELYLGDDAISELDSNSLGTWDFDTEAYNYPDVFAVSTPGDGGAGTYAIKIEGDNNRTHSISKRFYHSIKSIEAGREYDLSLELTDSGADPGVVPGEDIEVYFANSKDLADPLSDIETFTGNGITFVDATSFVNKSGTLTPTSSNVDTIVIVVIPWLDGIENTIYLDALSIKAATGGTILTSSTEPGTEMTEEMGYTPSFNLVRDWEHCIVFNGRAYFMNPWIEKKWNNFIMVSQIGAGFMYDAVTAGRYLDAEVHDGSVAVGMALLPNMDILVLKDNSIAIVDPETNFTRDFGLGKGCIARETIVNLPDGIKYCGTEDIYRISSSRSLVPEGLLDESIRDLYLAERTKSKIIAIRDKYNTYRFRLYNPLEKKEYILTGRGWIEQVKHKWVSMYRIGHSHQLWFMNSGNLYTIDKELDHFSVFDLVGTNEVPEEAP